MDLYSIKNQLNMGIPLTSIKLRVVIYARVSTDSLFQKKSLINQAEHFEDYISKNENWTYIRSYIDDGITGTSDIKREQFMQMIEDAKNDKFDLIVTKEISRFSRNTLDSIKYTRELLSYGVAVLFLNDNINTALPDSELRLTIMASMAQDEIRRLSERVKFGMNRAIERGEILGNNMLYGYRKDDKTKNLIIISEEAKIVKRIFDLYVLKKLSLGKIANILNGDDIKTNLGNKWTVQTLSRMIKNPKYKGFYCGHKSEVVDFMTKKIKQLESNKWTVYEDAKRIPPIISKEIWELANKKLNKKGSKKEIYLYSSKLKCKKDKCSYHRRQFRKNNKDVTWVCKEYLAKGKNYCKTANIRESELNYIFESIIEKLSLDLNELSYFLINSYSNYDYFGTRKELYENDKTRINKNKEKVLELKLKGLISDAEFYSKNNQLNKLLRKIEHEYKERCQNIKRLNIKEIKNKLRPESIIPILINHFIKLIEVSSEDEKIMLDIYPTIDIKIKSFCVEFDRGEDVKNARKYKVLYNINVI